MTMTDCRSARFLRVTGVVQGVGFRPFVHRLAAAHSLTGWVRNVAGTVEIHAEGPADQLDVFQRELSASAPPVARVDGVELAAASPLGAIDFRILASTDGDGIRPVTPDLAICDDCVREVADPSNARFRHAFITCTNCGPRYTVVHSLPYDRERTSMTVFRMCGSCRAEYGDPADRRHHAETIACPECGPSLWIARRDGRIIGEGDAAVLRAAEELREGRIVAIRGIGGFHLACDATSETAVARLRKLKGRDEKPFAVMVRTLAEARELATVSPAEEALLASAEGPIVLLWRSESASLAASVSPGLETIGTMLASTPLHHLLLREAARPLVMTSGNLSDEPIAMGNVEATRRLSAIADFFLLHDREIVSRIDDSVARVVDGMPLLVRRARGYAPGGVRLPMPSPRPLVAVGPHLKNTFTLVAGKTAHVSPHIGDLDSVESLDHFRATLGRYESLFRISPEVAVRDLHPGYLSSRIAGELELDAVITVQHHHAHVAAVAAEHGMTDRVVGVVFDGTGFGDDGNVWGAEFLVADLNGYRRAAHFRYVPLPGGDLAARETWRVALGYRALEPALGDAFSLAFDGIDDRDQSTAQLQIERRVNTPLASSMGRLFDAASAILGIRRRAAYEGHAAMELESLAGHRAAKALTIPMIQQNGLRIIDPLPLLAALGEQRRRGTDVAFLAARFHESIVAMAGVVAGAIADDWGIGTVALGGGSFQNARLLSGIRARLEERGLRVLVPKVLGPNDGAISYGQAAVAASLLGRV